MLVKKLSTKQKNYLIAFLNILGLAIATLILGLNYLDKGLIYQVINSDLASVIAYFEAKPFWLQVTLVMFLVLVEVVIGLIPAVVMYPFVGLLIGSGWGIFLIFIGNIIGNTINYYQGKVIARAFIDNPKNLKIINRLEDGGSWSLFLLRLNPLTSFDAISYFAGALGMKYKRFFVATLTGIAPLVIFGTIAGEEFLQKFEFGLEFLVIFTIGFIIYSIIKSNPLKIKKKKKVE